MKSFKDFLLPKLDNEEINARLDEIIEECTTLMQECTLLNEEINSIENINENIECDAAKETIIYNKQKMKKYKLDAKLCKIKEGKAKMKCLQKLATKVENAKKSISNAKVKKKVSCMGSRLLQKAISMVKK